MSSSSWESITDCRVIFLISEGLQRTPLFNLAIPTEMVVKVGSALGSQLKCHMVTWRAWQSCKRQSNSHPVGWYTRVFFQFLFIFYFILRYMPLIYFSAYSLFTNESSSHKLIFCLIFFFGFTGWLTDWRSRQLVPNGSFWCKYKNVENYMRLLSADLPLRSLPSVSITIYFS